MSGYVSGPAKAGDELPVTGPFGRFYLRPPTRPILMVAGGTGLAPMLSMLDNLLDAGAVGRPVRLLYGANTPTELFAADRLAGYAARGLPLAIERCVVSPDVGWDGPVGHVTSLIRPDRVGGDFDAYLCGPPPMIDDAAARLAASGVPRARIHSEKFLPS